MICYHSKSQSRHESTATTRLVRIPCGRGRAGWAGLRRAPGRARRGIGVAAVGDDDAAADQDGHHGGGPHDARQRAPARQAHHAPARARQGCQRVHAPESTRATPTSTAAAAAASCPAAGAAALLPPDRQQSYSNKEYATSCTAGGECDTSGI